MPRHASWLSVTPEPEQELPAAVATLVCGGPPTAASLAAETARVQRLILHGRQREWLRYLHGVVELIERPGADGDPEVLAARALARDVIANHHNLLLGLPGDGARRTAADRERLNAALADSIDFAHHT
jgi:hypothetical protein